jgi:hypothetical protein
VLFEYEVIYKNAVTIQQWRIYFFSSQRRRERRGFFFATFAPLRLCGKKNFYAE